MRRPRGVGLRWYGVTRVANSNPVTFQFWRMITFDKFRAQNFVRVFEKVGLMAKGTHDVGDAFKTAADALVATERDKAFTPMMLFFCHKKRSKRC